MSQARHAVLERGLAEPLELFPAVLALTVLRDGADGDEILVGVRTRHNVTHENVVSVPTIRVLPDVAARWHRALGDGSLHPDDADDALLWAGVRRNARDLMALKLGMGDALEKGDVGFDVELLMAGQGTSLIGYAEGCDVTERLSMYNAAVRLRWVDGAPRPAAWSTASYDPLLWLPVEDFRAMVHRRDVTVLDAAQRAADPSGRAATAHDTFELCVRGLCVESAVCALDDLSPTAADLDRVVAAWTDAGVLPDASPMAASAAPVARDAVMRRAERLLDALDDRAPSTGPADPADLVVVVKQPHAASADAVRAVLTRLLAFGIDVTEARRTSHPGGETAAVLYGEAVDRYARVPAEGSHEMGLIERRFRRVDFADIFGQPFDPAMVVAGRTIVEDDFGGDAGRLTAIWEEGRRALDRETLLRRYGDVAGKVVLGEAGRSYDWFRGRLPFGIQRLAPGLVAFALRHPAVRGNRPTVVLNGHVPGLADVVEAGAVVIGCRLPGPAAGSGPVAVTPDLVRRWVTGDDNRPWKCAPGTIRHDAHRRVGAFAPGDAATAATPATRLDGRVNVVHCSDGWLSGAIEARALLGVRPTDGRLARRLAQAGLTGDEVEQVVLGDPLVAIGGVSRRLSAWTDGLSFEDCLRLVTTAVPPVFGPANGWASGMPFAAFAAHAERLLGEAGGRPEVFSQQVTPRRLAPTAARSVDELDDREGLGRDLIAAGRVGMLVPAGGTAGRFGGYRADERAPERAKGVLPFLTVGGRAVSGLDIRLANARYWRRRPGQPVARVPLGVMASSTNAATINRWRWSQPDADIDVFVQHGVYRLTDEAGAGTDRWVDRIARHGDGSPMLKPPGNLGVLTTFVLSGLYDAWRRAGVTYLALGNVDDAACRLDPRVIGHMATDGLDALVLAAPGGGAHAGGLVGVVGPADEVAVVERPTVRGDLPDADLPWLVNTNQLYLSCAAVDAVMCGDGTADDVPPTSPDGRLERARRLVDAVGVQAERKPVPSTGRETPVDVVQFVQPLAGVLGSMSRTEVRLLHCDPAKPPRGHTPIKRPDDIAAAQRTLDDFAQRGDELRFATDSDNVVHAGVAYGGRSLTS